MRQKRLKENLEEHIAARKGPRQQRSRATVDSVKQATLVGSMRETLAGVLELPSDEGVLQAIKNFCPCTNSIIAS